jgi:hypothetical protein
VTHVMKECRWLRGNKQILHKMKGRCSDSVISIRAGTGKSEIKHFCATFLFTEYCVVSWD